METEYETVQTLKRSARGCVLLVQNRQNGARFLFRDYQGSGEVYRKLLTVSCPHLPRILEAAEQDGRVAVLEEYIQGDSLAFLLAGARLTPAQAREITLQLCRALWVLHSLGAVHRDVKPENVILRGSQAVLIDFDASRLVKDSTSQDTQVLGTTGYAAPEQYGIFQSMPATDIYALGVMFNELLIGKHPSVEIPKGRFGKIVGKCTNINIPKRYQSVEALQRDLKKLYTT